MKNKMDLHQTDNKVVDFFLFVTCAVIASELWQEIINWSLHSVLVGITVLLTTFLGYMAKNFWLPYYFPKEGKWKYFNFLRPRK